MPVIMDHKRRPVLWYLSGVVSQLCSTVSYVEYDIFCEGGRIIHHRERGAAEIPIKFLQFRYRLIEIFGSHLCASRCITSSHCTAAPLSRFDDQSHHSWKWTSEYGVLCGALIDWSWSHQTLAQDWYYLRLLAFLYFHLQVGARSCLLPSNLACW